MYPSDAYLYGFSFQLMVVSQFLTGFWTSSKRILLGPERLLLGPSDWRPPAPAVLLQTSHHLLPTTLRATSCVVRRCPAAFASALPPKSIQVAGGSIHGTSMTFTLAPCSLGFHAPSSGSLVRKGIRGALWDRAHGQTLAAPGSLISFILTHKLRGGLR